MQAQEDQRALENREIGREGGLSGQLSQTTLFPLPASFEIFSPLKLRTEFEDEEEESGKIRIIEEILIYSGEDRFKKVNNLCIYIIYLYLKI